jgi:phosphatidylinositol alpha-mannosyltransferase
VNADGSLRVAMVCPYSLSRPGGVQGQVTGLARALRARGHDVVVVAPDDRSPVGWLPENGAAPAGGTYVVGRSLGIRSNGSVAPVTVAPSAARRAMEAVRRAGVDVVHLHEPMAPVVGYECLRRHPAPIVATFHRSGESSWYRVLRPIAGWARQRIDVACAVSEAARDTAIAAMGGEYEVLFNGVDTHRFAEAEPAPGGGPATVLFLGRHEERKGLGVLLEAFDRLQATGRYPGVQLWISGDGPQTDQLRRRFPPSDRIHWLGVLSEGEVASRLRGAAVLCAPSLGGESFGMVLVEGMAARCAVIASDISGYRAAAGGHAVLVPRGDAAALATALGEVLGEAAAGSGRCSVAALDAAAAHADGWSMDRLAALYEERYRRVLG